MTCAPCARLSCGLWRGRYSKGIFAAAGSVPAANEVCCFCNGGQRLLIVPLHEIKPNQGCGPKAENLGRLLQAGLPVPPAVCIPGNACRQHLLRLTSAAELAELTADGLATWRRKIIDAPLAGDLLDQLQEVLASFDWDHLAVRSSASAEDLPGASFAGQHETVLGVKTVEQAAVAIRRCWASLWSDRAFEYRRHNGIEPTATDMAVIVQQLVDADVAGVIFTVNPTTGDPNCMVVEACWGLGDSLVSGRVSPDRFQLAKDSLSLLESETGRKTTRCSLDGEGGSRQEPVPAERQELVSLNMDQILDLARLGRDIERLFDGPQDIEFAVKDDRLQVLQARPVTVVAAPPAESADGRRQIWTNANTGEVMPDVVCPFTWSFVDELVRALIGSFVKRVGMDLGDAPLIGRIGGRLYFNLNTIRVCLRHAPGGGEERLAEIFGGRQDDPGLQQVLNLKEEDLPDLKFSWPRFLCALPALLWHFVTFTSKREREVVAHFRVPVDRETELDVDAMTPRELVHAVEGAKDHLIRAMPLVSSIAVAIAYAPLLYDFCRLFLKPDGEAVAGRLLAGVGNNAHAKAGVALWQLAQCARNDRDVRAAVAAAAEFEPLREKLKEVPAGADWLQQWDAFMRDHGHHCRGEIEVHNPRWREQPDYILQQVQSYLKAGEDEDFLQRYEQVARRREAALAAARKRFRDPFRRWALSFIAGRAQQCSVVRENLKNQLVRRLAAVRRLLLALGRKLTAAGQLNDPDEVFFMTGDELRAVAAGGETPDGEIATRLAEYNADRELTPPPVVVGVFDASMCVDEDVDPDHKLAGLAIMPGRVEGKARVILRAGDDQVLPGEILVAPFTDPGWTPYFLNAAAIVMDQGGLLSHGAIVAREYGIPAVVNVGPATRLIKTGDTILVDADHGVVTILDTESRGG